MASDAPSPVGALLVRMKEAGILSVVGLPFDKSLPYRYVAIGFVFREGEPNLDIMMTAAFNSVSTTISDLALKDGCPVAVWLELPKWQDDTEGDVITRRLSARLALITPEQFNSIVLVPRGLLSGEGT